MFKIRWVSRDTCQDYLSPQSLQLFPAVSVDGVTQNPKVQLSEQFACGYRLDTFPLTPCFAQRQVLGRSSFFRRHKERVCCVWLSRGYVCCVHSTSETSAEGLQLTLRLALGPDMF